MDDEKHGRKGFEEALKVLNLYIVLGEHSQKTVLDLEMYLAPLMWF